MKTAYLISTGHFEVRDNPIPPIKKGQALIAVKSVGICASDVHYFSEGRIGDQVCRFPQMLGHECGGVAHRVFSGSAFREGDRVAVEPGLSCGTCEQCKIGNEHLCPNVRFLGMPGMPGAFQEFIAVDERQLSAIPDGMTFHEAALLEPMAVACHAMGLSRIQSGQSVAIFGAGAIGLCALAIAKVKGAGETFVFDTINHRLEYAKKTYKADHVVNVQEKDPLEYLFDATRSRGVDISVEAAGAPETFEWAFSAARAGGKALIIGIPAIDRVSFDAHSLRRRELLVQNIRRSNGELKECIELVHSGKVSISGLATHHFLIEQIDKAFEIAAGYKDGVIRARVEM
jgi:L-iditol 2-dehydrogenase